MLEVGIASTSFTSVVPLGITCCNLKDGPRLEHIRSLRAHVIYHVLPRVSVGNDCVFSQHEVAQLPSLRTSLPSIIKTHTTSLNSPLAVHPASVAPQQTPLDFLMEASLSRKTESVSTSKSASPEATTFDSSASTLTSVAVPSIKKPSAAPTDAPKPKRKRIRIKTPRRREQCRNNQARYRKKKTEYAKTLEATVKQLRDKIPKLEMQHKGLVSNAKSTCLVSWRSTFTFFGRAFSVWIRYPLARKRGSKYPKQGSNSDSCARRWQKTLFLGNNEVWKRWYSSGSGVRATLTIYSSTSSTRQKSPTLSSRQLRHLTLPSQNQR